MITLLKLFNYCGFSFKSWLSCISLLKGMKYYRKGQKEKAVNLLSKAIKILPTNSWAHYCLGFVYQNSAMPEEAAKEFGETLSIDPNYRDARIGLMEVFEEKLGDEKSEKSLRKYIAAEPDEVNYRIALSRILYVNERFDEAVKELEEAAKTAPNDFLVKEHMEAYRKPITLIKK